MVSSYVYKDKQGRPLFEVNRWEPKSFTQARIEPDGRRVSGQGCMRGVQLVPYRLPALIKAVDADDPVYVVEGERDADALWAADLVATTNPGGSGKWRKSYSEHFRKASDVRVIADNDPQGQKHAQQVAEALGTAKERLRALRSERERLAGELSRCRVQLPTAEELMPMLREKLRNLEATLKADVARGRLVLGSLGLSERRLRVYRDGRIEGTATLAPETQLPAPRGSQEPGDSVVAGGRIGTLPTAPLLWAA